MVNIFHYHTFVHTDHLPLTWILTKRNVHPRLEIWLLRVSIYDFEFEYIPGEENIVAEENIYSLSEKFGPIDYVVVLSKTSLEQEDYVEFLAFDNPKIHKEFVEVFNKPLQFLNRSMLFEVNQKPTNVHQQILNRNRFMENLKKFNRLKRYFDEQSESTEPKLRKPL
ncbi:unnamed protein product [Brachionus calyciflorus]|uniref:Uncharacterized protein n=1 Tax=Brachionus calyciflorus TaxID=104777 RepID=A0A814D9Q9_9BILA|nr:unnamed protein product [Brachionus calyciflorus]